MKKIKYFVFAFAVFGLYIMSSCEKDDICAEGTPTTPQLILRFYDLANPDETQSVPELFAFGLDDDDNVVDFLGLLAATTDSIVIPLRTTHNSTRFVLQRNYASDGSGNPDVVTVNYLREDVYVSRACGFKTIFNSIALSVALDGDNWIINSEILQPNVENENQAHVKVLH